MKGEGIGRGLGSPHVLPQFLLNCSLALRVFSLRSCTNYWIYGISRWSELSGQAELVGVRMERDLLKKAAEYFAKESLPGSAIVKEMRFEVLLSRRWARHSAGVQERLLAMAGSV